MRKETILKRLAALLICAALLSLCACTARPDQNPSDSAQTPDISDSAQTPETVDNTQTPEVSDGAQTVVFTDSAGRTVTVPAEITKIAASGATAQMILMTLCPELLIGLASSPSEEQRPYFPESMWDLPTFGQFYGSKANLNMEALIAAEPQIVIDLGDPKDSIAEDMDMIQEQTGIPTVFIEATLSKMPAAYRTLGELLGRQEQAEKLAAFVEETLAMAERNRARIPESEKKTVMFGTGSTGLACNAAGSSQADVIDLVGGVNAIVSDEVSNKNGGTAVDLEQVYTVDPDVILLSAGGPYETLPDGEWAQLQAVRNGEYYEIPNLPYSWMSAPPSVNRVLGVWWLGNLLYPELYDYDIVQVAQEFYGLFWHHSLSEEEAAALLSRSGRG